MTLKECYDAIGGDYEATMGRMLNKESLVKRIVLMFLKDPNHDKMVSCLEAGDCKAGSEASHTLKGASLNLGFNKLGELSHQVTEALRKEDLAHARELAVSLTEEYNRVTEVLKKYQAELEA